MYCNMTHKPATSYSASQIPGLEADQQILNKAEQKNQLGTLQQKFVMDKLSFRRNTTFVKGK